MLLEKGEYVVYGLDSDGYELATCVCQNRREAVRQANRLLTERELIESGLVKVEVHNASNECMVDMFI